MNRWKHATFSVLCALLLTVGARSAEAPSLVVRVKTRLGVDSEVAVRSASAGNDLLDKLSQGYPAAESKLVLRQAESRYVLIPWTMVKGASRQGLSQILSLVDGSQLTGKVATVLQAEGTEGKSYDLGTTTAFNLVSAATKAQGPAKATVAWTLTAPASSVEPVEGFNPRFVFQYYSSSGYIMGGSDREEVTTAFKALVEGEAVAGNLSDFDSVAFAPAAGKPTLTLKAPGGTPVTGALKLVAHDDRGDHEAQSGWFLALDLPNGCTVAVKDVSWKLLRRN